MTRLLSAALLVLACLPAYAITGQQEPPLEHASPMVVVLFAVLFFGSCVGYGVYLWWRSRKDKQEGAGE